MLLINAVKLFHTHPQSLQKLQLTKSFFACIGDHQKVSTNEQCAVCAFNFIKDAEVSQLPIIAIPELQINIVDSPKLPVLHSINHSTISGRAPPCSV